MKLEDVLRDADEITVGKAAKLTGQHANSIRNQLRAGKLVNRHVGREWLIPVIYDDAGDPVFLWRPQRRGK